MGRSNFLRLVACFLMLLDHAGQFLFPDFLDLRIIGRLAFPLFCYLIAEGFFYTRDLSRYGFRLVALACFWQPFHLLLIYFGDISSSYPLNVLFTLLYGLILIVIFERYSLIYLFFALVFSFLVDFALVPFEYGTYGALMVLSAHVFRSRYCLLFLSWGVLSLLVVFVGVLPWIQAFCSFCCFSSPHPCFDPFFVWSGFLRFLSSSSPFFKSSQASASLKEPSQKRIVNILSRFFF